MAVEQAGVGAPRRMCCRLSCPVSRRGSSDTAETQVARQTESEDNFWVAQGFGLDD